MATGKPVGSFYVQLGLNSKQFQKNLKASERDLKNAFGSAAIRTSQMLAAALAGLTVAVAGVAAASVKLAADLERQQVAFTRLMGSSEAAKQRLKELQEFASNTPYTFTELVEYEKRLQALGFAATETRDLLTTIGDAASGLGMGADGVGRIIKAFGDIRAKGYMQTQEIRQLAETGIPAFEMLAKKLKVDIPTAMDMVEDRAVNATTALAAFTEGINERFGGMMALQSQTMLGMWSSIVDEAENTMRIVGSQIEQSTGLKSIIQQIRDAARAFRTDLENKGFTTAFSNLLGEKAKFAIVVTAGAITGALIPAVVALKIALMGAFLPLTKVVAAGAAIAAAGYAIYKAWERIGPAVKQTAQIWGNVINQELPRAVDALYFKIKAGFYRLVTELAQYAYTAVSALPGAAAEYWQPFFSSFVASSSAAAKESADQFNKAYGQFKAAEALTQWMQTARASTDGLGFSLDSVLGKYVEIERIVRSIAAANFGIVRTLAQVAGYLPKDPKKAAPASGSTGAPSGKSSGKSEAEKLADEAKSTSDSIYQSWLTQAAGKAAVLDYQYRKELETLEKTKAYNKNYKRDLYLLDETYYQQKVELAKEAQEAENKKLVETAQSRADFTREQIENEWALTEAHYERLQAIQDGSALEAQLNADKQAADLEAYMQHLNAKTAADRAYLEGRRNLISVYDQLQADANRTNADYMAEGYRTVYSGLTEALTGIVTGAKNAGEAFKQLGMEIIQMVVKWTIQRKLAAVMSKSLEATQTAASVAMAAATAAAWAPAAAMVAAATFGASTAAAGAGLASLNAMSRALAIPGLAEGGIVNKPTLAMIGEGNESEAVIPLSKLNKIGGNGDVQVNVINQTGAPVAARSSQRIDNGRLVVDMWLEGYSRNVSGIQDIVKGRA